MEANVFCLPLVIEDINVADYQVLDQQSRATSTKLDEGICDYLKNLYPIAEQRVSKKLLKKLPISCSMSVFALMGLPGHGWRKTV